MPAAGQRVGHASTATLPVGCDSQGACRRCRVRCAAMPAVRANPYATPDATHTPRETAILADLDERQRAAVTHESPLLAILAPAGSGKTRVLTRRIAWWVLAGRVQANRVLAVTFTRKAAGELRTRLSSSDGPGTVTAGTFHSLALAMLRRRATEQGREFPSVLDRKGRLLAPMLTSRGIRNARLTLDVNDLAGEIEWAKARTIAPGAYAEQAALEQRRLARPATEIAELYERYEIEKRRRGLVDFDDLLSWCAQAFERDADFAAAQRFRFRSFFVDEFQDVTPSQLRLLRAWLGDRRELTVVGDDAQAIYSFAGAQPDALVGFDRLFPGAATVRLATNYRSTPEIVAVTHAALASGAGSTATRPLPSTPRPVGILPTVRVYDDDEAEALAIASALRAAADDGRAWHSMAVLYRTNAQSALFESTCGRLGVPVRLRGTSRFLERAEVRAAFSTMELTQQQAPGHTLSDHRTDLVEAARVAPTDEEREHLEALARLASEYLDIGHATTSLAAFRMWLETATRGDPVVSDDAVELATFHAAKGLEWPMVFVTGVEAGLVPIGYARTPQALAEEQRLLHVALSRAVSELHISWARRRADKGRRPCPWLADIEEVIVGLRPAPPAGPGARRQGLASARSTLRAARPVDELDVDGELLATLKQWRLARARAHDLPAFTIFHDATLAQIAAQQPTTVAELREIRGVGDTKLERYGDDILGIVRIHVSR
jgi:DNA helicase-2/ATP-dependent DNA helicase PcrA